MFDFLNVKHVFADSTRHSLRHKLLKLLKRVSLSHIYGTTVKGVVIGVKNSGAELQTLW